MVMGDLWIIAPRSIITGMAEWCDRTLEPPRYIVHPTVVGIAIGFDSETDEVLFDLIFPGYRQLRCPYGVLDMMDKD